MGRPWFAHWKRREKGLKKDTARPSRRTGCGPRIFLTRKSHGNSLGLDPLRCLASVPRAEGQRSREDRLCRLHAEAGMSARLRVMSPLTSGFSPTSPKAVSLESLVPGLPNALIPQSLLLSPQQLSPVWPLQSLTLTQLSLECPSQSLRCQELAPRPSSFPSPPPAKPSVRAARPSWNNTASFPPTSTGLFTAHQGLHTHELTGAFPTHPGNPAGQAPLPPFCRWRH